MTSRTLSLFIPLPLEKLYLLGRSGDVVERVFESAAAALPGKRILLQQQQMEPV